MDSKWKFSKWWKRHGQRGSCSQWSNWWYIVFFSENNTYKNLGKIDLIFKRVQVDLWTCDEISMSSYNELKHPEICDNIDWYQIENSKKAMKEKKVGELKMLTQIFWCTSCSFKISYSPYLTSCILYRELLGVRVN